MATPYLFYIQGSNAGARWDGKYITGRRSSDSLMGGANLAPDLQPMTGFDRNIPQYGDVQLIDVINDFEWTHTPAMGRHEVPFIRLSEYKVNFNSLMQNIRYLLSFINKDNIGDLTQGGGNSGTKKGSKDKNEKKGWGNRFGEFMKQFKNVTGAAAGIDNIATNLGGSSLSTHLHSYYGLYGASPTGFNYYFPYFQQDWKSIQTRWGDIKSGSGGIFSGLNKELFTQEGILGDILNTAQVDPKALGTYIERPQMFDYGQDSAPSIDVTFNLINTTSTIDIIRNWHLCFLLMYQNLPNKTSKVLLEPPVIYEAEIPGLFYSPYAYISRLKITNRGATRVMKLPLKKLSTKAQDMPLFSDEKAHRDQNRWDFFRSDRAAKKTMSKQLWAQNVTGTDLGITTDYNKEVIETIIPDAYQIDMTIQSLIPESQNLLYHSTLGPSTLNSGVYTATIQDDSTRRVLKDKDAAATATGRASEQRKLLKEQIHQAGEVNSKWGHQL